MNDEELKRWHNLPPIKGCILDVDLEYPEELHDLQNKYPCPPERIKVGEQDIEHLIPTLSDKKRCILHCEALKMYVSLGLKETKIHLGIIFTQRAWLKPYVDLNTDLRAKAKNDFEKDFFKLMNNSVFGKTMENIRNRVNVRLVSGGEKGEKKAKNLAAKPSFEGCTIFDDNLVAMHIHKTKLVFNKPVHLGISIPDIGKIKMYNFHYGFIKSKYSDKAKLLFTHTDSLAYEVMTDDFFADISDDVYERFDTSNFESNHPSGIPSGKNKKVIGMFKDETGGKIIEGFVVLRAMLHSYMMFEPGRNGKEEKKCKGIKKSIIRKTIGYVYYLDCLFNGGEKLRQMNIFRRRKYLDYTEEINKVALSSKDNKRIILPNNNKLDTLAYAHRDCSSLV